jgi:hypothetical protein
VRNTRANSAPYRSALRDLLVTEALEEVVVDQARGPVLMLIQPRPRADTSSPPLIEVGVEATVREPRLLHDVGYADAVVATAPGYGHHIEPQISSNPGVHQP